MTTMIRKMAAQICFLSATGTPDGQGIAEGYEVDAIESMVARMATIFQVNSGPDQSHQSQQQQQQNQDDILTKVVLGEGSTDEYRVSSDAVEQAKKQKADTAVDYEDDPELASVEAILADELATAHFRMFLNTQFTSENLQFYDEVKKYQHSVETLAQHIFKHFISESSDNQVNIDATMRKRVTTLMDNPSMNMFTEAQSVCMTLMTTNSHTQFLRSKNCQAYLIQKSKNNEKKEEEIVEKIRLGRRKSRLLSGASAASKTAVWQQQMQRRSSNALTRSTSVHNSIEPGQDSEGSAAGRGSSIRTASVQQTEDTDSSTSDDSNKSIMKI
jgi:hypothetical protein